MYPRILMYHDIAADHASAKRLSVPVDDFASQLHFLYSEGFETLTASTVACALADGRKLPERAVVITFDDGFADLYEIAFPILSRYNFTITVFITTEWIQDSESSRSVRRPGRMLSWSQIRDLAGAGFEIGAHSCSHPQLDQLSKRYLEDELRISKAMLEDELQRPIAGMAYPFGYSNIGVRRMAQQQGYKYACAVGNRIIDGSWDQFALPRLTVKRGTSLHQFQRLVYGRNVATIFLADRVLTRGWTAVRYSRKLRILTKDQECR